MIKVHTLVVNLSPFPSTHGHVLIGRLLHSGLTRMFGRGHLLPFQQRQDAYMELANSSQGAIRGKYRVNPATGQVGLANANDITTLPGQRKGKGKRNGTISSAAPLASALATSASINAAKTVGYSIKAEQPVETKLLAANSMYVEDMPDMSTHLMVAMNKSMPTEQMLRLECAI
jgi:hypothetical protein